MADRWCSMRSHASKGSGNTSTSNDNICRTSFKKMGHIDSIHAIQSSSVASSSSPCVSNLRASLTMCAKYFL